MTTPAPFLAEIRVFPFTFAPKGWAECDGQLLTITDHTALFDVIGTTYGGDGARTFALPNLQGSVPVGPGNGAGLSPYSLGAVWGSESETLSQAEMPSHNHLVQAQTVDQGDNRIPSTSMHLGNTPMYSDAPNATDALNEAAMSVTGNSEPHNNLMPYLTFNFCIAIEGVFPKRDT